MINLGYRSYLNAYMDYDGVVAEDGGRLDPSGWLESPGGGLRAHCSVSPWDGKVFGVTACKVNQAFYRPPVSPGEIAAFLTRLDGALREHGCRFAAFRTGFGLFPLIPALESAGWRLGDILNIYHAEAGSLSLGGEAPSRCELGEPSWTEVEEAIPDPSAYFTHSRVARDAAMPPGAAKRFFSTLLRHTFDGPGAIKVALYKDGILAGLAVGDKDQELTGKLPGDLGFLWLIAMRPEFTGQGLARPLLRAFLERLGRVARHIEIGTQVDNTQANRLYQGMGLKLAASTVTFHRWFEA